MACFLISVAEAAAVSIVEKVVEKKENGRPEEEKAASGAKIRFSRKLKWLRNMLWGGSALLAFEHLWHGEIVPFFPFLTAASDPGETAEMLREMATVGVSMALLVTLVWAGMVLVTSLIEKSGEKTLSAGKE